MPEYPHLSDTVYPDASGVDVYKYKNEFDYDRWFDNVEIKLCDVPWENDGRHVVKFDDDTARDAWFDSLAGETITMQSMFHTLPSKTEIKVPIPYPRAIAYNYVRIKVPLMPASTNVLDYEKATNRYEYQHWFVMDVESLAPNTTQLVVQRDWWTDFINSTNITHMMLERGHAPMSKVTVEDYLTNPITHTEYLGAKDVNYGGEPIVKGQDFTPIGEGEKWWLVFSNMEPPDWTVDRQPQWIGDWNSTVEYSDKTLDGANRSFTDYNIKWDWNYGHYVYHTGYGNTTTGFNDHRANRVSNNVAVIAIKASDVHQPRGDAGIDIINAMHDTYPQWFQTIFGIANVSEDMIQLGTEYQPVLFAETSGQKYLKYFDLVPSATGYIDRYGNEYAHEGMRGPDGNFHFLRWSVYEVTPQSQVLKEITLTKEMFNMPEEYENIAKLYTYPYSHIEVVNESGRTVQIRVEEINRKMSVNARPIYSYPWVKMTAFIRGVGGDAGNVAYQWKTLTDSSSDWNCYGDKWKDLIYQYDIPVFSIYQAEYDLFRLNNYSSALETAQDNATRTYHNAIDGTETDRYNAVGNNGHAHANDNFDNFKASDADVGSAYVAEENAYASAKASRMNSVDTAKAGENSTNKSRTAMVGSANNTAINTRKLAKLTSHVSITGTAIENARLHNDAEMTKNKNSTYANWQNVQRLGIQGIQGAAGLGQMALGTAGSLAGSGGNGGNILSAVANAGGQTISIASGLAQATYLTAMTNTEADINNDFVDRATLNAEHAQYLNTILMHGGSPRSTYDSSTTFYEPDALISDQLMELGYNWKMADANAGVLTNNTALSSEAMKVNASRSKVVVTGGDVSGVSPAESYKGTALRSEDATQWQARNSLHKDIFNANKTGASQRRSAKRNADSAQASAVAKYRDAHRAGQRQFGEYRGEAQWDALRMRGLQFRFMRQSDGAIAAAGDQMLRYGYMYDRAWRFEGFNLMAHFTYWKCSDVWLTGGTKGMVEEAQDAIKRILYNGTTVWHNPSEVGAVSIYENWR